MTEVMDNVEFTNEFEGGNDMNMDMEFDPTALEATNRKVVVGAFAAGALTGALAGGVAWYTERSKRMSVLKQLEVVTIVAQGLFAGAEQVKYNKKDIDLSMKVMENPDDLIMEIKRNIDDLKLMRKSERKRWNNTLTNLIELSIQWEKRHTIAEREIAASETVETLNEQ